MKPFAKFGRQVFAMLLCLSFVVWSVMPTATHAPKVLETIENHFEMISDHGHSHGFQDLYWAIHGHSHDVVDHDHSQPFPAPGSVWDHVVADRDMWRLRVSPGGPPTIFRIERPPRA